jgi:flagellar biosynthesis protein FliP
MAKKSTTHSSTCEACSHQIDFYYDIDQLKNPTIEEIDTINNAAQERAEEMVSISSPVLVLVKLSLLPSLLITLRSFTVVTRFSPVLVSVLARVTTCTTKWKKPVCSIKPASCSVR